MADKVTLHISIDSSELEDLGKKWNVLERLRSLEFDLEKAVRRITELEDATGAAGPLDTGQTR